MAAGAGPDLRMTRVRELYQRAVYVGDAQASEDAETELDGVEADLLFARGRLAHTRYLTERELRPEATPGDPEELATFERALRLYRRLGDVRGEGEAQLWIGLFHQVVAGSDDLAVPCFERSLELATEVDDTATMAEALRHLGIADHRAGRLERAREELEASVRLRRELGLAPGVASNLIGLTYIAAAQGRRDDAIALLDEASALASASGALRIERHIHEARADLDLA